MTTFGWDASHYDAPPTARDGIDFYTHKITDGNRYYEDPEYQASLDAARGLGIPILGSYHVLHGGVSIGAQAGWWLERVTALTPWWQSFPLWIWQIDAEQFDYLNTPTIAEVNALGDEIVRRTGCPPARILAYAPPWLYGQQLTGLHYRLWSSNYGNNPEGPYRTIYPGDNSARWSAPVEPLILQYGSGATIAGQTTCDANAFRGSLDQLKQALGGAMPSYVIFTDTTGVRWASNGWERERIPIVTPDDRAYVLRTVFGATVLPTPVANPDAYGPIRGTSPIAGPVTVAAESVRAIAVAVDVNTRDAVADLGEGGAARVRQI
jgi:hypothetical protein